MNEADVLARAREERGAQIARHERSIERLRAYACAYPIVRLNNAHGHDDTCPAAAMIGTPPRKERP